MSLKDIISDIRGEGEQQKQEKNASKEDIADEVKKRALEKISSALGEDVDTNSTSQIDDEVKNFVKEASQKEVTIDNNQKEKIASVSENFEDSPKAQLFEKLASAMLNPRIIIDQGFQKYEDLQGNPKQPGMFQKPGAENVNQFPGGED